MTRKRSRSVRRGAGGKGRSRFSARTHEPRHKPHLASRLPYNLLAQLKGGVHALRAAVDNLVSNWAYMVMTALAWNLKAWLALQLPEPPGRQAERQRSAKQTVLTMEFKTFVNAFLRLPCQIIRTSRRLVYRLLSWNPWQEVFFRMLDTLRC